MTSKRRVLMGLIFAVVFILGMLTGGGIVSRMGPEAVEKRAWQVHQRDRLNRIVEELNLTPEQQGRIRPLIMESLRVQRKHVGEMKREAKELDERIYKELTEEQRERFRELRKRERQHLRDRLLPPRKPDGTGPGPERPGRTGEEPGPERLGPTTES